MTSKRVCLRLVGTLLTLDAAQVVHAQATAPSSITPPSLRPDEADKGVPIALPESGGLLPPTGAEALAVTIDHATVEGGFPELAATTRTILAPLDDRRVTLAEVYRAASEVEAAYARAGFVLARVTIPPQSLIDGGTLRIVIVDGFVEDIDVSGVPSRVRHAVERRVAELRGRHHVKLSDIEQVLLIANDIPGLTLSSTLARGTRPGATRLILAGTHKLVSGQIGADNSLASSLGTYGFNAQVSVNSALGLGEQVYGFAAAGYKLSRFFDKGVPVRVLGGGVVLPFGDGRFTLNPEATFSRTQPHAGADIPRTRGDFRRLSMRAGYTLFKTRAQSLTLNAVAEQIDETNALTDFGIDISHDRFIAARLGVNFTANQLGGSSIVVDAQLSHGLGGLGALRLHDLPIDTGFSRQGSSLDFTKFNLSLHALVPLPQGLQLTLSARGQTSFGHPLFRSEQAALEGNDALSAYVGGVTAVDEAIVGRAELGGSLALPRLALVSPYVFIAGGTGRIDRPTIVEPGNLSAGSAGVGLRAAIAGTGIRVGAEYAHGFADYAPLHAVDRVNASISLRF